MRLKNIAIITGASSGIGMEFVKQIDSAFSNIDEIWLIARRKDRLAEIQKQMNHTAMIIPMDVTDEYAMDDFEELLDQSHVVVRMLINAAGMGIIGTFDEIPIEEQLSMLTLNCESLTKLTYIVLPYMVQNSRIIQMASSAAFFPQPEFAIYAATKSYVLSLSRALNQELKDRGICVTSICPGPVKTEFFNTAEIYHELKQLKKLSMISSEKCVKEALFASTLRKDMVTPGITMKLVLLAAKILPHSFVLKVISIMK